jgi:hypothetical protein
MQVIVLCLLVRIHRYKRRTLLVASYRTRTHSRTPIRLPHSISIKAQSPPDLYPPLPHHLTLILLSRKHYSPSHSTPFPFIPTPSGTHNSSAQQIPHNSNNISVHFQHHPTSTTKTLSTISSHSIPSIPTSSDTHNPQTTKPAHL